LTGLAIATRTGGIITHAYLLGALLLCGADFFASRGRLTLRYLLDIGARYGAVGQSGTRTTPPFDAGPSMVCCLVKASANHEEVRPWDID
jgi:hypothetical protein